jgi:hydroxyethylthiazole kinase
MTLDPSCIANDLDQIRSTAPLVHNITNYVVMNTTANALLALGASPVMAHAEPEAADMTAIAQSLVINIGTLSNPWIRSMAMAMEQAAQKKIPIVLDPVGVGATAYRTRTALDLIQAVPPTIIRGNGSEIMALAQSNTQTRGVDSTHASDLALASARQLSRDLNCTVCITGEIDYIVSGSSLIQVNNGHAMMAWVTGMGCTATALCGAFAAVSSTPCLAAAHALCVMGLAGEMAGEQAKGPGSFQVHFLDALYQLSPDRIHKQLKISGDNP